MANLVTEEERNRIIHLLRDEGKSQNATAKEVGRGKATVSRIAAEEGIDSERSRTKKASEAKRDYAQAERLLLLNEGFDKARELLPKIAEARDLQSWMIAVGTGIDKRRLEDGEATNRSESRNENYNAATSLEDEFRKLDSELEGSSMEEEV